MTMDEVEAGRGAVVRPGVAWCALTGAADTGSDCK